MNSSSVAETNIRKLEKELNAHYETENYVAYSRQSTVKQKLVTWCGGTERESISVVILQG